MAVLGLASENDGVANVQTKNNRMSEIEESEMRENPQPVTLGRLIGRELRNGKGEMPSIKYGQAALAKKGEDYFLIIPEYQRIPGDASTSFSVFAVLDS